MEQTSARMRVSNQMGRVGSASHNARYSKNARDHIDYERTKNNSLLGNIDGDLRHVPIETRYLDKIERERYKKLYQEHLDEQNKTYISRRQYKRVKKIDDLYAGARTKPMELILQVGKQGEYPITSEGIKKFKMMVLKHVQWLASLLSIDVLSVAIHTDEQSLHAHIRYTVMDIDKSGHLYPQQDKGLARMGIEPPDPTRPISRYNNRQQSFTKAERAHWISCIKEVAPNLSLELVPEETPQRHLQKIDYQVKSAETKLAEAEKRLAEQEKTIEQYQKRMIEQQQIIDTQLSTISILEDSAEMEDEIVAARSRTRSRGRSR